MLENVGKIPVIKLIKMSIDSAGRKLADLRVYDLREELEKRSLEVTGNKNALVERLQKALRSEGHDPENYLFGLVDKKSPLKKLVKTIKTEKTQNANIDVDAIKAEVVDEIGTVDEEFDEDELQEGSNNDITNNDNEESINLTIEEDEQTLLHAQAQDDKEKNKNISGAANMDGGEDSGGNGKDGNQGTDDRIIIDSDDEKNVMGGNKNDDADEEKKNEDDNLTKDSEQKSSSKSATSKDDKEKSTSGNKNKSTTSSSRNLWVSGLSSLTRASDLKTIFSKYGKVIGAKVVTNTRTPGTRCYGYVTMSSSGDASKCIEHLHRTELHGRIISVERTKSEIGGSGTSLASPNKQENKKHLSKLGENDKDSTNKEAESKVASIAGDKTGNDKKSDVDGKARSETSKSRPSDRRSRSFQSRNRSEKGDRDRKRDRDREILSFQKIREERERQRLREKERELRDEERRRRDIRKRQRDEEHRLRREREKLQLERERLEKEKADLLRLERERQKLEREKLERERLELKKMKIMQTSRIDDNKRPPLKRPTDDRYTDDRKRSTGDRRFEPPPPPRFDSSIARAVTSYDMSSKKSRDDYSTSKRDDYKRDIDVPRQSSNYQSSRDNHKDSRYSSTDPRSSSFRRGDDRDSGRSSGNKQRFESTSYTDRAVSGGGSGSQWHNSGASAMKSFTSNITSSSTSGLPSWVSKSSSDSHWRPVEPAHDRYDRTYNERSGQYIDQSRPSIFTNRPQDRYTSQISRYENGKY